MIKRRTKTIVLTGVMSALAWVLMALEFPLFVYFPSYLKIDFSDLPAIFGGIIAGPLAGVAIELVKNILHFITMTREGGIGEIANFSAGVGLVVPIIIAARRNERKLFLGFAGGIALMAVIANLVNYFITLPLYMKNPPAEVIMGTILAFTLPFNIVKGIIVSAATYFLHLVLRKTISKYKL